MRADEDVEVPPMRQPGERQISHILLSAVRYTTRTDQADQNEVPRNQATHDTRKRHSALDTDPEGCQTIQNQYPGITSYPNHVLYLSWPIDNYRPYVLLRIYNPNNILRSIQQSYNSNTDHTNEKFLRTRRLRIVFQLVFLSSWKISILKH